MAEEDKYKAFNVFADIFAGAALRLRRLVPGGVGWAVQLSLSRLIRQQKYEAARKLGSAEFQRAMDGHDSSAAFIAVMLGHAYSGLNDDRQAIEWYERAANLLSERLEKDALMPDDRNVAIVDLAACYTNLAAAYFRLGDKRKAFQLLNDALNKANEAPPSPYRDDVIATTEESRDHLVSA